MELFDRNEELKQAKVQAEAALEEAKKEWKKEKAEII